MSTRSDEGNVQYVSVAVGNAVTTLDGKKIGVISEVRGTYFKIKTSRWQRDYWLRVDSVRSAQPQEPVVLNVPQSGLEGIKMVDVDRLG